MTDVLSEPKVGEYLPGEDIEAADVPEWFLRYFKAATKSPLFAFSKPFETWVIDKVATSGFDLPISQIIGFTQFLGQIDEVATGESTSSTSYTDLATAGPELTGLPDGRYMVIFGADVSNTVTGFTSRMSVKVNAVEATDADSCYMAITNSLTISRAIVKTLSADSNTLTARYRVNGNTGTWASRWLIALKIANL